MTTSNQLLPCPFCGGSAAYQRLRDGSKYGAYECGECGAQGPDVRTGYGPEEEWHDKAAAAWNERSSAAPPAAAHGDEAMRKDAERYRWISASVTEAEVGRSSEFHTDWRRAWKLPLLLSQNAVAATFTFDEAIDAAMRAQGDGGAA